MNCLEIIAWTVGAICASASIAVFSIMALFYFADRAADKSKREP
jgi:hypothetical protein